MRKRERPLWSGGGRKISIIARYTTLDTTQNVAIDFLCISFAGRQVLLLCYNLYVRLVSSNQDSHVLHSPRENTRKDRLKNELYMCPFQYSNTVFFSLLRLSSLRQGLHCPVHRTVRIPLRCVALPMVMAIQFSLPLPPRAAHLRHGKGLG